MVLCLTLASPARAETDALEQARQAVEAGRYQQAVDALSPWLTQHPRNDRGWFLLGVAWAHLDKRADALAAFRKVTVLKPRMPEPHVNMAALFVRMGDAESAIDELELALALNPDMPRVEVDLANLLVRSALRHYRRALGRLPADTLAARRYNALRRAFTQPEEVPLPATAAVTPPVVDTAEGAANGAGGGQRPPRPNEEGGRLTAVLDALEAWRKAWAAKDLNTYFAAYAEDFTPPRRFGSRAAWRAYKQRVIRNKPSIRIRLEDVRVRFPDATHALVRMTQHYRAGAYASDDRKQLAFRRVDGDWKIVREEVVP